eukprot:s1446_g1.t1
MLTTPCLGREYKHTMKLVPRPIGRGLKCNKRHLPLFYILGLNNCKASFFHSRWFTRIRAIKRCLDQVMSRRTLANMTGKRPTLQSRTGEGQFSDCWAEPTRFDPSKGVLLFRSKMALLAIVALLANAGVAPGDAFTPPVALMERVTFLSGKIGVFVQVGTGEVWPDLEQCLSNVFAASNDRIGVHIDYVEASQLLLVLRVCFRA